MERLFEVPNVGWEDIQNPENVKLELREVQSSNSKEGSQTSLDGACGG